ncbi:serine hydrolase domain-containing protein [Brumimicrobium aurantiacum]|uniref:Class C beta-lactamase-related serine hydrolase n=1 Tax=Brumimicrobium aurantiacum TaxID=1737063 RepID=A0A3E1EUZ3_9FLAO|nr:serine hydrolase [Brumimicrobium aurantiacum]RFC53348.1 class C beta-lactamase-related serine hydrolase [Brumimicrobium aurantiacum]
MKKLIFLFLICSFIFTVQSCKKDKIPEPEAPSTPEEVNEDIVAFNSFLDTEFTQKNLVGLSVLVFKKDQVLHQKQLGKANIQNDENLTANHLFSAASSSKIVTATALLQLFEYGHFALDDNISDFLPFNIEHPNSTTPITFEMLLTHTSGIADGSILDDHYYDGYDSPLPIKYFIEEYLLPGGSFYNETENFTNFEPGTQYEYTNVGTTLMALLVEEISSQDFPAYCQDKIFSPMGMTQTYWKYNQAKNSSNPIVTPYNDQGSQHNEIDQYTFTHYPSGGLRTTVQDMMKFYAPLANDGNFNNTNLLHETTTELMFDNQIPNLNNQMGYHVYLLDATNYIWGDDKGIEGASAIVGISPFSDIGVIVYANQSDVDLSEILDEGFELALKL